MFVDSRRNIRFLSQYPLAGAPYIINKKEAPHLIEVLQLLILFRDSLGARTQDPNIKSVVLYLLS